MDTLLVHYNNNTAELRSKRWGGSPDMYHPQQHSNTADQTYLTSNRRKIEMKGIAEPERPDWYVSDDENLQLSNNRQLTRQELKQLDRELP